MCSCLPLDLKVIIGWVLTVVGNNSKHKKSEIGFKV